MYNDLNLVGRIDEVSAGPQNSTDIDVRLSTLLRGPTTQENDDKKLGDMRDGDFCLIGTSSVATHGVTTRGPCSGTDFNRGLSCPKILLHWKRLLYGR